MRILFALPYVPSLIRVRPYNLIRQLAQDHEVTVVAIGAEEEMADASALRELRCTVVVVPFRLGEAINNCLKAAIRREPLQAAVCRSRYLEQAFCSLLANRPFDVVHIEHLRAAHLRALVPDGFPTLFDSVDCISLLLKRTLQSSHSLRQRVVAAVELGRTKAYEARLLSSFDTVVATSPEDCSALRSLEGRARVVVVPNGVDLQYFRPLAGPREPATIVLSGKMSYHANVTAALHFARDIFPLVRKMRPEARLRIVGSNPPRSVRDLARDPAISVIGYLPDIREAVGSATVAVCPVIVKVGIQNKVLEAMAMGVPVVCTRQGHAGLIARPDEDLLVADNPAEFAEHVCRLLADPNLCQRLGRAGREYVEAHHRWTVAAQSLEALYREAVQTRAKPQLSGPQPAREPGEAVSLA